MLNKFEPWWAAVCLYLRSHNFISGTGRVWDHTLQPDILFQSSQLIDIVLTRFHLTWNWKLKIVTNIDKVKRDLFMGGGCCKRHIETFRWEKYFFLKQFLFIIGKKNGKRAPLFIRSKINKKENVWKHLNIKAWLC